MILPSPENQAKKRIFTTESIRRRGLGWPIGLVGAGLVMLAIPVSQYLGDPPAEVIELQAIQVALPPPPPPVKRETPPPPPEEKTEPPAMDEPPPQLSLEQLELALNPGVGGDLVGDFSLGNFAVDEDALGGIDIFEVEDLDSKPRPRSMAQPYFDHNFLRRNRGEQIVARIEFILDEKGRVENPEILFLSAPGGEEALIAMIRKWRFDPPTVKGTAVKARYVLPWRGNL